MHTEVSVIDTEPIERLIIPPAQAQKIVANAGQVYLRDCVCRVRERACPPEAWNVCLLFEHASEDQLRDARPITLDEALSVLQASAEQGLINQLFYRRNSLQLTEICSCCTCCCAPLRNLKETGNYAEQLRSGYVAVSDEALCVGCGLCLDSCFFDARRLDDGVLTLADERCFGCGRCVESCPEGAIRLEWQAGRGMAIPGLDL
jgi:electron transport complex protein RnfB